jgi:N-acetylneuraminic acid mutarotase
MGEPGLSTVEEYDPASDTWTSRNPMPTGRFGLSAGVVDGKIYVVGGTNDGAVIIPTLEEYDPAMDTWTAKQDMATARALVAFEAVGGMLYAIGGGSDPASGRSTVEVYDPVTDSWTVGASMPTPRSSACSGVVDDRIYVIGGADGGEGGTIYGANEEYDPASSPAWTAKPDMPTPRAGLSCSVLNGQIYAIGGTLLAYVNFHPGVRTVEEYDPNAP